MWPLSLGGRIVSRSENPHSTVRVWDVRSGKCLEVIQGSGGMCVRPPPARKAIPLRALVRGLETVVERAHNRPGIGRRKP